MASSLISSSLFPLKIFNFQVVGFGALVLGLTSGGDSSKNSESNTLC